MTDKEFMNEMRQDMLNEEKECNSHECQMRRSADYFIKNSIATDIQVLLVTLKNQCEMYDQDYDYILETINAS